MITPVLLRGGSRTGLWPLSRKSYPKQFTALVGETTLFQASAQRLSGPGYAPPVLLTNSDSRFIVTEQLAQIGIGLKNIIAAALHRVKDLGIAPRAGRPASFRTRMSARGADLPDLPQYAKESSRSRFCNARTERSLLKTGRLFSKKSHTFEKDLEAHELF